MSKCRFVIMALVAATISCGNNENNTPTNNFEERVSVQASRALVGNMTIYRDYTGTLEGIEQAVLTAKVAETVTGVKIRPGDSVSQGDILILLDKTGPTSSVRQAQAYYENAKKTIRKMQYLYDEGAISEQQYDNAKTEFEIAEANYGAARDLVEIRSPIDGVVTDLRVNAGDQTMMGQKLATVSRIDSLRLTVGVDPDEVQLVELGMAARVYPVGFKEDWTGGAVTRVASSADPKTRAFKVEVSIAGSQPNLKPGTFAGCTIPLLELENVIRIPDEAVVLREGLHKAYIVRGDTAVIGDIVTGESSDGYTQVVSGVDPGDMVVTVGQAFLEDRSAITLGGEEVGEE